MQEFSNFDKQDAIQEFRDARRKAAFQSILSFFTGKEQELLKFDDIKKQFGVINQSHQELDYIEIDKIVGSVGRYKDFDRNFLPKNDSDLDRWTTVRMAMTSMTGVPPIEVYQIGEVYFVLDGNHRVSAARSLGNDRIEAYVTKFNTNITISAKDDVDAILLKAEYAEFLDKTRLDTYYPELKFQVTEPGRYKYLFNNIKFHELTIKKNRDRDFSHEEIMRSWVTTIYLPVIERIAQSGIMRDFPKRTETDLFAWLLKHQDDLEESLGWKVTLTDAFNNFLERFSKKSATKKMGTVIKNSIIPRSLSPGPETGQWREEMTAERTLSSLFASILVPLSRNDKDFVAIHQALHLAKQENAAIRGLIVLDELNDKEDLIYKTIENQFYKLCEQEGVEARLVYDNGQIANVVTQRAVWNDLIVMHLFYPPEDDIISRLRSGLREIIQRSSRPILLAPCYRPMQKIMVAYDRSEKAKEALFLASYLTAMWNLELHIFTNTESRRNAFQAEQEALQIIERYYINATFLHQKGILQNTLKESIQENDIDLLLMGGYSHRPLMQMIVGSSVDQMLRELKIPMIICQ